jgi:hypothetical protein
MLRRVAVLGLTALAAYSAAGQASAGDAPSSAAQGQLASPLPAALVALEQKMEELQVRSERFSQITRGSVKLTDETNGKPVGRTRHVSLDVSVTGEVSLSPSEGELWISRGAGRSRELFIGSTTYVYSPKFARRDGGRPWRRLKNDGTTIFPYHGSPEEADAWGTGPYAGLINLLATASGEVAQVGPATVDGQQTIEFSAAVDPFKLVKGLTQEDVTNLEGDPLVDRLTLYLTESGLPVRVLESIHNGAGANMVSSSATTDILATEVPVRVTAPPAAKTIDEARLRTLQK